MYETRKSEIKKRLEEFSLLRNQPFERLLPELVFCLLTPGTSARRAAAAVLGLQSSGLLTRGSEKELAEFLRSKVRFHNNKAKAIVSARQRSSIQFNRNWLVKNIRGLGWKEASHFLRNVGYGNNLAIIDRHILKNLVEYKVIKAIPKHLSKKEYLSIEKKMKQFSRQLGIPPAELDLLLWSKETGEVFK